MAHSEVPNAGHPFVSLRFVLESRSDQVAPSKAGTRSVVSEVAFYKVDPPRGSSMWGPRKGSPQGVAPWVVTNSGLPRGSP